MATLNEQRTAERYLRLSQAFQLAEAGLDDAIVQLRDDSSWSGRAYTALSTGGGYEVSVTSVSSTLKRLTSTGHYPSNNTSAFGYQSRQLEAYVATAEPSPFDYALFAANTIQVDSNAAVDSYNSDAGVYGGANVGTEGDVGSNATGASTINLAANSQISGDAVIGVGGNTATAITKAKTATISGLEASLISSKDLTPETYSASGSAPLTSSTTLAGGAYNYTNVDLNTGDSVLVTGNVTLYVDQYFHMDSNSQFVTTCTDCSITIYVKGDSYSGAPAAFDLASNCLLSAGAKPTNLTLYVTAVSGATSTRAVNIRSNTPMYGAIHAPLSTLTVNSNIAFYGAAIAKSITLNSNAAVHYDVALQDSGMGGAGSVQVETWREL